MCPRSSDTFYIVTFYIKWVITSWTPSSKKEERDNPEKTFYGKLIYKLGQDFLDIHTV